MGHPLASLYTLPLLVWYALQVIIGAVLVPPLAEFAEVAQQDQERIRLHQPGDPSARSLIN